MSKVYDWTFQISNGRFDLKSLRYKKIRNRKLKSFKFKGIGLMDDDFIRSLQTVVIYYLLNGQKIRRIWYFKMTDETYSDLMQDPKLFANFIYTRFKHSLNIKHT